MAQKRIFYRSDFKLFLDSQAGWSVPFRLLFYTDRPQKGYEVGYDGHEYHNCSPDEYGRLTVAFDNHCMGLGVLMYAAWFYLDDKDYADGVCDQAVSPSPVRDKDGNEYALVLSGATGLDFSAVLPPYYQMGPEGPAGPPGLAGPPGPAMTYEDLTSEQKQELASMAAKSITVDAELSQTSENPVQNKVVTEELNRLGDKVFPITFSVSGGSVFEKRSTQDITVRWSLVRDGQSVTPDKLTVNGTEVANTSTSKVFAGVTANTTYSVVATKSGKTYTGSTSASFVNPKYFGVVGSLTVTEDIIKGLAKTVSNGKGYTGMSVLDNARTCYAYPKSFGTLSAIKDANNFDYLGSYVRSEMTVWDETYYVYVLKDATTHSNFKQIYS